MEPGPGLAPVDGNMTEVGVEDCDQSANGVVNGRTPANDFFSVESSNQDLVLREVSLVPRCLALIEQPSADRHCR